MYSQKSAPAGANNLMQKMDYHAHVEWSMICGDGSRGHGGFERLGTFVRLDMLIMGSNETGGRMATMIPQTPTAVKP